MCKNIGSLDKAVRIIIGLAIIIAGFYYESWWGLVGLIPLLTALSGHCPCYRMCNMNTCGSSDCCGNGGEEGIVENTRDSVDEDSNSFGENNSQEEKRDM